jgi:diguanylate cyclase (GGDEF)-like protein
MDQDPEARNKLAWLLALPPHTERTVRMEALIARLRLVVLALNAVLLGWLLNTNGWHEGAAWWCISFSLLYAIPTAFLQPYRRWRVFGTSFLTTTADSVAIAVFIAATGASNSPFYVLFYLGVASVAMRFDLPQALTACFVAMCAYSLVYFWTWDASTDAAGILTLRLAYMALIAIGVGHLAKEEDARARQIEQIERLHEENRKLQTRHDRANRVDRLTGVFNRANFEREAARELRKAKTSGGYLSVLFCDMDHLKRVNDELGHDIGDRVLRAVGAGMKHKLRSSDIIGRYGGDEFIIMLPNVTRETAFDRADQLIEAVGGVNSSLPDDLHVGLSVGIATYPFDAQDYATLVRLADQSMYLAKRAGGDRSRSANDLRLFWEEMPNTA